ncbi:MAG: septation ring formation regulator EzrA [bacterium]|nr:septation ring formation regulator EzrA [bacterium]
MNNILLIVGLIIVFGLVVMGIAIFSVRKIKIDKYKKEIDDLEVEKNKIIGVPILSEITKVRELVKTDNLKSKLNDWDSTFKSIKEVRVPKLSDMLAEADFLLSKKEYKQVIKKIANIEIEIKDLNNVSLLLLDEISVITKSEERNRAIITKLKVLYRELKNKFERTIKDYGEIGKQVNLEFETIGKLFQNFEEEMDRNDYVSVEKIVYTLEDKINRMKDVLDKIPSVVLLATMVIPRKIDEVSLIYTRMIRDCYPLDYLNVEYNVKEIRNKIDIIMNRLKKLEVGDSILELKTMLSYFDGLLNDFDREKESKNVFHDNIKSFKIRLEKLNKIVYDIYLVLDEIRLTYDLKDIDIKNFYDLSEELEKINADYKTLCQHGKGKTFAYSKLVDELDGLGNKLSRLQDDLDYQLQSITSMKDDEYRAREQMDAINSLLKQAKNRMKEFKFPVIPNSYFTELTEAQDSIKEIVKELDKKPIVINVLNVRVDTARDLVFKIHNKTNELLKYAIMSEKIIVYGNRYRSSYYEIRKSLEKAEDLFNRGMYLQSFETSIKALESVEVDISKRIVIKNM